MKKLIIHPGVGKTATSAIQHYAFTHLNTESISLRYSPFGLVDECHNGFADSHPRFSHARFNSEVNSLLNFFDRETTKDVLISTEFLVNSSLELLQETLIRPLIEKGVRVEIILVTRSYPSFLISAYLQALKTGYGLVFGESLLEFSQRNIELFRVGNQLRRMLSIQVDQIILVEYDRYKSNMLDKFFELCGHEILVRNGSMLINPSLLPELVPLIRNFDKYYRCLSDDRSVLISKLMELSGKYREVSYNGEFMDILRRNGYDNLYTEDMRIAKINHSNVLFY